FIPNVFTPNGDNVNDWLVIDCLDGGGFPENSIVIYNQWGGKVYEAAPYDNDQAKAWRGTLDGEPGKDLPDGAYYYVFRAGPNEPVIKGFIEIYR
ncbi:MAG: gliding motility-associated C-terminal domain-containing protein, partial [Saprospiraceae bacterium]|nr:gliding motility-associated C-terminal domain-containing protein [Saprospiraceae bacterium]